MICKSTDTWMKSRAGKRVFFVFNMTHGFDVCEIILD